jgi:cation diffusion facilitator family transporter
MTQRSALRRVGLVVLGANAALALAKGAVYLETGSLAVGSEAVNSFADTAYSLIIVGGLYLTTKPPDFEHPHGHERIEPFVSLLIAVGIFVAGGAVLWQAFRTLQSGAVEITQGPIAVGVLAVASVAKYGLYRYCLSVAESQRSPALRATAIDNRNDILASSAALVGVLGAGFGVQLLDPLAAFVVGLAIFYTGLEVARDNLDYLVGAAPSEELRTEILRRALAHPEVEGAHDVIAHYVGPEIDVSLHIEVQGDRTLLEAHEIETEVMASIRELPEVDDVYVHVDPREAGEWKQDEDVDHLVNAVGTTEDRRSDGAESTDRDPRGSKPDES